MFVEQGQSKKPEHRHHALIFTSNGFPSVAKRPSGGVNVTLSPSFVMELSVSDFEFLIIDLSPVGFVDTAGVEVLATVQREFIEAGVLVFFAGAKGEDLHFSAVPWRIVTFRSSSENVREDTVSRQSA